MAEQAMAEVKYLYENKDFPILYEDLDVRVYKNPSNEIFVVDVQSGATIRLRSHQGSGGGLQFTASGIIEPIQIQNLIGWRVIPRH